MDCWNFKVFLKDTYSGFNEIRRFDIEKTERLTFKYICETLQNVFPAINGKTFTVSYKDEQSDQITISSDKELHIALHQYECELMQTVQRLYVTFNSDTQDKRTSSAQGQIVHENIICDACDSQIQGFRYKCIQCYNYDLCFECEAMGLHPEHIMIRIPLPMQWLPYKKRLIYHIKKLMKKVDPYFSKDEGKDESRMKCRGYRRGCGYNYESPRTTKTEMRYPGCVGPSANASNQREKDDDEEYIDSIDFPMEGLIQMLKSFGINFDLDLYVNKNRNNSGSATTAKQNKSQNAASGDCTASKKFRSEETESVDDKKEDKLVSAFAVPAANQNGNPTKSKQYEWTLLDKTEASSNSPSTSASSGLNDASTKPTVPSATEANEAPQQSLYPSLPEKEEKVNHPNPKIRHAIETMISMGFSNKGGLLTYLLEAEDGNVSRVLDLVQPTLSNP